MAEEKRHWYDTKVIGIKRLKDEYEKNKRTICPSEQIREWENLYTYKILPGIYGKGGK